MWQPGDIVVGRGIFNHRVWTAIPVITIKDTPEGLVAALLPGTECMTETDYAKGRKDGKRRWDFKYRDWSLAPFLWRTNRVLMLLEPDKFYSIRLFWQEDSNKFLGYYVNFQLPYKRSHCGIDTLDLELDIEINPDFSFEWKDLDDYKQGIEAGIIQPEWADEIETAKIEILDRLEKRRYPFDGSWLNWMPDPNWSPPALPQDWDIL
jgi:protein associated with RNAse G/E